MDHAVAEVVVDPPLSSTWGLPGVRSRITSQGARTHELNNEGTFAFAYGP